MAQIPVNLDALHALPAQTARVRLRSTQGASERTFRGATFFSYARVAGLLPDRSGEQFAASYIIVTAEDGMRITLALAEVLPSTTDKQVMLVYEQNGEPLRTGARLVVPGDDLSARSLVGVSTFETRTVDETPDLNSKAVELYGLVAQPGTLDRDTLAAAGAETIIEAGQRHGKAVEARHYSGMKVYELLERAGIQLNPAINEDFVSKVIIAWARDGSRAVIAGGEIEPRFMNGDAIVAVTRDGSPLPDTEGPARLVLPFDRLPGRSLKQLVRLELREG